ncbi:tectonic-3 isoform X2 [Atheta coriaria]|uniref:tectonic-3 isoform X2 n=1 Tax=Dalotia coriaria TaxID=877792 RepID=UPI0031F3FA29
MNMKALILLVCLGWLSAPICSSVVSTIATTSSPKVTTLATVLSNSTATTLLPTGTTTTEASCTANNGTCGNVTTSAPNVKGSSRKEKWKNEPMQPSYYKFKMSNRSDCDCDLRNRFCDINCCCDKDCSLENKQVFSFCQDSINLPRPNSRYCNYMQYIYNNRTLYEEEVHQNSLFCIAKTNLPAHYYKQKKKIILQPLHANIVIKESSSYQWSNAQNYEENFLEKNGNLTNHTAVFGDSIYVLKNYSNPQNLELVANFITPDCTTTKPVHYVQNLKTTCRQTLTEHNSQLFLRYFKSNWTTIASLRFLNISLQNYEGCPKNVCIPFNLKQCNLYTCWNLSNTTTSACTTKMCTNIVTKVKYTFVHNGTHGIQGADLSLTLENITLPTSSIDQEYEVKFLWINQTEFNYTNYRSGNPGYQINKPILFAKLITVINATTNSTTNKTIYQKTQYLKRPALNYIENFLVLPKNVQGKCLLSPFLYENLNFGYNMLTKCIHGQGFVKRIGL